MSEEQKNFAFTETRLRNLNSPPEREYYADSRTRGFKLAVYLSGAKTFLIYRRVHGRPERIFIGRWPDLDVEQARKIAEQMNGLIAKGENPAQQQRQQKLEGTLSNLFERYLELHARPHKQPRTVQILDFPENRVGYRDSLAGPPAPFLQLPAVLTMP
jgi:hypothetical protein